MRRKATSQKCLHQRRRNQWFLQHFPVIKPSKHTTRVRIVFDAAMKHGGKSLNDCILPGPKLQREIVDVLTRFHRAPIALSGDIAEMFLQVGLQEKDRPYHRFLWQDVDPSREPDVYEFRRLLFGNMASPFCAQYVVHAHAQAHTDTFPAAAESIDNAMYVDDLLDSSETTETAHDLQQQPQRKELHFFSDASKDTYAAVSFLVCHYDDGSSFSRLAASKCRVAPAKVMTIPRLESSWVPSCQLV